MIGIISTASLSGFAAYYFFRTKLPAGTTIDRIEVWKSKRRMCVFSQDQLIKTYRISLGKNPIGAKQFEGDNKTPEGSFTIIDKNPNSSFHKNLGISYPDNEAVAFAAAHNKLAGGDIKIHGLRNGFGYIGKLHRWKDWTAGCIAITDNEIDELYLAVIPGSRIDIYP